MTAPAKSSAVSPSKKSVDLKSSVLIDAVLTTVMVTGLAPSEAEIILDTWEFCNARVFTGMCDDKIDATLSRAPYLTWTQFHENLVSWITVQAIRSGQGELFMFHAAALSSTRTGASIVLVAESGTGKTTATKHLGKTFAYLTDETAAFDNVGRIYPYAKPLSLFPYTKQRPKNQFGPKDLGLVRSELDCQVGVMAVLDRDSTGEICTPIAKVMTLKETLLAFVPQMSSLGSMDRGLLQLCRFLDQLGGAYRLRYSEAIDLPAIVDDLLDAPTASAVSKWSPMDIALAPEPNSRFHKSYRRTPVDDAIKIDDDIAILMDHSFYMLTGLMPMIWECLSTWKTRHEIFEEITSIAGNPPGAQEKLQETLDVLLASGIMQTSTDSP